MLFLLFESYHNLSTSIILLKHSIFLELSLDHFDVAPVDHHVSPFSFVKQLFFVYLLCFGDKLSMSDTSYYLNETISRIDFIAGHPACSASWSGRLLCLR